jgi:murein DD-endopeptidase MepM/ murein hydrolase activator NlpD
MESSFASSNEAMSFDINESYSGQTNDGQTYPKSNDGGFRNLHLSSKTLALKKWALKKGSADWYFYIAGFLVVFVTVISVTLPKSSNTNSSPTLLSANFISTKNVDTIQLVSKANSRGKLFKGRGSVSTFLDLPDPNLYYRSVNTNVSESLLDPILPSRISEIASLSSLLNKKLRSLGEEKISYRVQSGDTFVKIWRELGAKETAALDFAATLNGKNLEISEKELSLREGERIELVISKISEESELHVKSLTKRLSQGRSLVITNVNGSYKPQLITPEIETRTRVVHGVIRTNLASAASDNNIPFEVVDNIVDLFGDRFGFDSDLQSGDTFVVKYDERFTKEGESLGMGPLSAASIMSRGRHLATIRYEDKSGQEYFFDEAGRLVGDYFLKYPVKFSRISAVFSDSRLHPVLKYHRPHYGVDFAAPTGTPVRTVGNGVVVKAGYYGGAGNMIKIRHDNRYSTAYLHLSRIDSNIRVGSTVKRGQLIGAVGTTGLSTGPHLHFSLYENGVYIDPLKAKLKLVSNLVLKKDEKLIKQAVAELAKLHKNYNTTVATVSDLKDYREIDLAA